MAVTGDLGGQQITLNNAAQEETLARILAIMSSANNANSPEYQKLLAQSAVAASQSIKQSGQSVKGLGLEADDAKFGVGGLGRAATGAKRYMDSFGASMTSLGNTLNSTDPYGMTTGLVNQTAQLAQAAVGGLAGAFGPIGAVLGGVAKAGIGAAAALTGIFVGAMSKTTAEFNKMQAGGALFGGDLIATRRAAHGAGLTMEQLNGVVGKAGKSLAVFGGQTSTGAREFGKANAQLIASQGDQMLRMGISYEEMGIRTAEYMETLQLSGQRMGSFGTSTADVAAGAARLAKQQKMMSALNGDTIEAEKAKQKAVRQDAAFQATISQMSVDQRNEMEALMRQFPHLSGAIKEAALTGDAFSVEGSMAVENAGLMGNLVMDAIKNVREGTNVTGQLDNVLSTAEANAEQVAKDQARVAEMASMSIFGTGNAMIESAVQQFLPLQEASMKANTQAYTNIKTDMDTLQNSASAATTAMTDVAKEFQNAQVNVSKIFTEFLDSGGGKVMIEAVTMPIKALGIAIQTASDTIAGKNSAVPGGADRLDPEKMKNYAAERNKLQSQLADPVNMQAGEVDAAQKRLDEINKMLVQIADPKAIEYFSAAKDKLQSQITDIQKRASLSTVDQKFAQYNASMMDESSGATGSFNKKQAEEMEAQRQEQLAKEAEAAQKRLDEINKIMPANEQSEQSGFDMTVDILVKVYKALTDQNDTLSKIATNTSSL